MKILFICRANVGRSQIAEAFFNRLSKNNNSISAGAQVKIKIDGLSLADIQRERREAKNVIDAMAEYNYDFSNQKVKQLTKEMVEEADKIIVMCDRRLWPNFLKNSHKVECWNFKDPKTEPFDKVKKIRDQIKNKVEALVKKIG